MTRAFSLLEVMVSGAMLIAGPTGIVSAMSTAAGLQAHQRKVSHGIHIAESVLEELLIRPVADAELDFGTHPSTPLQYDDDGDRLITGTGAYQVQWTVSPPPPAVDAMRTVTTRVTWTEGTTPKSFSLSTIRR